MVQYYFFQVLKLCKFLLLQTAAPDAIIRLEHTKLVNEKEQIQDIYFRQQHHRSIEDFLKFSLQNCCVEDTGMLMQVSAQQGVVLSNSTTAAGYYS